MTAPDFTEIEDVDEAAARGYTTLVVSIFDHWLTEAEASACEWIMHDWAQRRGRSAMAEYLRGEARFLDFYRQITAGSDVYARSQSTNRTWRVRPGDILRVVRDSLRERRLMDLYLQPRGLRIRGGYDRTDLLLSRDSEDLKAVEAAAIRAGLFRLE